MYFETIWIIPLSFGTLIHGSNVTGTAWMAKPEFNGYVFENNINWKGYVNTRLQCFWICSKDIYCQTLFYNSENMTCHCNAAETDRTIVSSPRTVAYQRGKESIKCPLPDRFNSAPPHLGLLFRIVFDNPVDQPTAQSKCQDQSASLVIIDTVDKQNYLRNILLNCQGYGVQDYWIDGYDVVGNNKSYQWRDGRNMTMDDVIFWAPNTPDNINDRCVRMQKNSGYLWNDRTCTNTYGYICEL